MLLMCSKFTICCQVFRAILYLFESVACLSVSTFIVSIPEHDTDLRPISLEPEWPQEKTFENNFPEKWAVRKMSESPNKILSH
jgi:hypothetical protein